LSASWTLPQPPFNGRGAARKANDVLEALGLPEFVEDWVLDLNKELG
jgi:hypothetical protein